MVVETAHGQRLLGKVSGAEERARGGLPRERHADPDRDFGLVGRDGPRHCELQVVDLAPDDRVQPTQLVR